MNSQGAEKHEPAEFDPDKPIDQAISTEDEEPPFAISTPPAPEPAPAPPDPGEKSGAS